MCGAIDRDWTGDLILTKDTLYRLSYNSLWTGQSQLWSCFYLTVKKFGSGGRTWTNDLRVMSPTSYQLLNPAIIGGGGRIRTFEGKRRQIYSLLPLATREPHHLLEPTIGLEPTTYWLQVSCSTIWATLAYCSVERSLLYQRTDVLSRTFYQLFYFFWRGRTPFQKSLSEPLTWLVYYTPRNNASTFFNFLN